MPIVNLSDHIKEVASLRAEVAERKSKLDAAKHTWELEHQTEFDMLDLAEISLAQAEFELKKVTLRATAEQVKAMNGLVKVRNIKTLSYTESDAIAWAADQKQYGVLSIKKRDFEKAARDLLDMGIVNLPSAMIPSFVEIVEERQATIARDLSGAI